MNSTQVAATCVIVLLSALVIGLLNALPFLGILTLYAALFAMPVIAAAMLLARHRARSAPERVCENAPTIIQKPCDSEPEGEGASPSS